MTKLNSKRIKQIKLTLLEKQDSLCALCNRPLVNIEYTIRDDNTITIDHIIPKAKGGTNNILNLRLVHHKCNSDRGIGYCGEFNHVENVKNDILRIQLTKSLAKIYSREKQ